jgi:hypothetical protein
LKSTLLWDITTFRRNIPSPSLFDPEDGDEMFLRNVGRFSNVIHDVISQKIVFFITTGARTSNPTI